MNQTKSVSTVVRLFAALFAMLALQVLMAPTAWAQHTSIECPPQSGTVTSGGLVTIDVTDCATSSAFYSIGVVDGGSTGTMDFPNHGSANLRISAGRWYVDYSHNGSTGIGSTDVFEFTDGTAIGNDVVVTVTINAATSPITVSPSSLPTLRAGTPFSQTLSATGGTAPYTFTLQSGALPPGISMSSSGVLTGTPTERQNYSFSVRATDSTAPTALFVDKGYTGIVQNPTISLVSSSGTAIQGAAFSQTIQATGGVAPYIYTLETGTWPSGISLASNGVLSGTTNVAPGSYPVTIRVQDSSTGPGVFFAALPFTLTVAPPPTVSIAVSPASASEDGATNLTYTVTRSANLSSPTVVNLTTTGTATAGTDYTGNVATVTIPAGATTATVTIDPTAESTFEPDETVTLTVAAGTGYTVGAPSAATGTILNDDAAVTVSIAVSPSSVSEDGATNLTYTVTRSAASASALTVNLSTSGTASSASDYTGGVSTVTIAANATTATVTINPTTDTTSEADETVILTVAAGAGYTVGSPSTATGTISNDDGSSVYCPTLNATVSWGGTVSINAGTCSAGFGLGTVISPPAHGTATVGTFGANQPIIYTHNGSTGTTDTFTVNDGDPPPNNQIRVNITITPQTSSIVVSPASLPALAAGTPVNQALSSTGGTGPYTYSVVGGALPVGLSMTSAGVISGTPTERGSYSVSIRSLDSLGAFTDKGYSGTVTPGSLALAAATGTAIQGVAFSQTLSTTGGLAPYSYLLETGSLPSGITLSSAGVLSGTTSAAPGSFPVSIRVTDSSTGPGSYFELESFTLTVATPPTVSIAVSPASVSEDGATNLTYTVTRSANLSSPTVVNITTAGTATAGTDYTGNVATVTIPAGATTATVTIDPTADSAIETDETVTLTVAAGTGYTVGAPSAATGTIAADEALTLTVNPTGLNPITVGASFTQTLSATGGTGPYTFTIESGALPTGLSLASDGTISGLPSRRGTYTVTIRAQDSLGAIGARTYTGIALNPTIVVTPTNLTFIQGSPASATLAATGGIAPYSAYSVIVGTMPTGLTLASDGTISGTPTVIGTSVMTARVRDASTPGTFFQNFGLTINIVNLPTVSISANPASTAEDGAGNLVYTVTRDVVTATPLTVNLTTSGTATSGTDYTGGVTSVTIPANAASATVTIDPTADTVVESNETVTLTIASNAAYNVGAPASATATITNDDLPTASIAASPLAVAENGATNMVVTVTLDTPAPGPISINFTLAGTATNGGDYAAINSPLTIAAGASSGTLIIDPNPDGLIEPDETVIVTLAAGTGYQVGAPASTTATILNDDLPSIVIGDITLAEGNTGTTNATFTISLSSPATASGVTFDIATLNGSAIGGQDFVAANQTGVTIAPGSSSTTFVVAVNGDLLNELDETFRVQMSNVVGAVEGGLTGTATITNDDALPTLSVGNLTAFEGNLGTSTLGFQIQLSEPSGQTIQVSAATADGTATGGVDFVATNGTVSFQPGETSKTFPVTINADTLPESDENFTVALSGAVNAVLGTANATGTIINDDVPITVSPASLAAGAVGVPYSQTITATGGTGAFTFAVTAGAVPGGLVLNPGGVLSGTPNAAGVFNFTVTATDSSGAPGPYSGSRAYTVTVAAPTLSIGPASVTEGNAGTTPATFTVTLSGASAGTVTVDYATANGSAIAPGDYAATSGTLTFAPGETTKTITVNVVGDTAIESAEVFSVNLTNPVGATFATGQNFGTILNDDLVSLSINDVTVTEGNAGTTAANFTVSLSQASAGEVIVQYATANNTAFAPSDYTAASGTLTFAPGETSKTVTVNVVGDTAQESDELFNVDLSGAIGATIADAQGVGTITNDDTPLPTVSINDVSLAEGNSGSVSAVFTISLSAPSASEVRVSVATANGTAVSPDDYTSSLGSVSFAPGETVKTVAVAVIGDLAVEPDETFFVNLGILSGATIADGQGVGTITNDDTPAISINDVTVTEGNSGTTNAMFTATLSAATSQTVTVNFAAGDGTANAPGDYTATSGTLTFTPGQTTQTFTVPVVGDLLNEENEQFQVTLSGVTNATLSDANGVGTITDDDALPSITINDVTVTEGNVGTTNAVFTVRLSAASGRTVGVSYATAAGTASAPGDYTGTSGTLNFAPGQTELTVTVPVIGDGTVEANETFFVNLSAPSNATLADAQGQGTISNDDVAVVVTPGSISGGAVGVAYSQALGATGGTAPYTLTISAGALPAGVTLSSSGTLSGTPTASGTFTFTVQAADANSPANTGTQAYSLTIAAPTVDLPAATLPGGTLTQAYSATINPATGGTAPYTYAVTGGALPVGLALNATTGAITGTPTALGTASFTITATDSTTGSGPYTASQTYSIGVVDQPPVANAVSLNVAFNAPTTNVPLNITGGAPTNVAIATAPTNGTATVSGLTITYQPRAGYAGTDSFTYTATNSGGTSAPAAVTVAVANPTLAIAAGDPLTGRVAVPYTQTFTFSGGTAPYGSYTVTGLPSGLSVTGSTAATVTVAGTPSQAGSFNLTVAGRDSSTGNGPFTVSQVFALTVAGPNLTLTPATGSFAPVYAAPFSQAFTAGGGVGPYSYALTGSLPAGLTLNAATGVVSGTPTASGNFSFGITATDTGSTGAGAPFTVSGSYTMAIAAPVITVTPDPLPAGTAGQPYTVALAASGAVGPYTFALTSGTLPAGVSLSTMGQISGTPTASGTFPIAVQVRDANSQVRTVNLSLTIAAPALTVTPASLPGAKFGFGYSQQLTVTGGIAPYNFAISSGALPAGLTLNGTTGLISGTPTAAGPFPIAVTVRDSTGGTPATVTVNYTLQVEDRPDPASDQEVTGLVQAQADAAKRFASTQIDNFRERLERLHDGGTGEDGDADDTRIRVSNSMRIAVPDVCRDAVVMANSIRCQQQRASLSKFAGLGGYSDSSSVAAAAAAGTNAAAGGTGGAGIAGRSGINPAGAGGSGPSADSEGVKTANTASSAPGAWGIWTAGLIRFGDENSAVGRSSMEFRSEGISIGADYRFSPSFAAGVGFGYGRDSVDIGNNGSRSRGEAKTVALYGSFLPGGGVYIDGLVGYQWLDFDLRRYVTSTGRLVDSQRTGHQWFGYVSVGAEIAKGNWQITPYAQLEFSRARLNGYAERSGSVFDLVYLDQQVDSTQLGLGTKIGYSHLLSSGARLSPELRAEYKWQLERSGDALVTYADRLVGPYSAIRFNPLQRDELVLGAKLDLELRSGWLFGLEYIGRVARGAGSDSTVKVIVTYEF